MVSDSPAAERAASPPATGRNLPEFSVGELSQALKKTIEQAFSYVRVRGEISGAKLHGSGHLYLCLKDADAAMDAVCWRHSVARLDLRPEDGMEVICTGKLTTFPGRSKYQLVIERMELAGAGALLKLLEDRKKRLAAEGLFDADRKRPLPFLPDVIGVVTSPTGAVIRDILHRLADRFPRHVLVWPVAVQGEGAAAQVAAAIAGFNALPPRSAKGGGPVPRPDLLIVARGGGSLEDLMAFNDEAVVRAAAASRIPLISAVGHETDTTLIDFASDRRAPTPTAAAEMAVPVRLELLAELAGKEARLAAGIGRTLSERTLRLAGAARGLPDAQGLIGQAALRLDDRTERLGLAMERRLHRLQDQLAARTPKHPRAQLDDFRRAVARESEGLDRAWARLAEAMARRLEAMGTRLDPGTLAARIENWTAALTQIADRLEPAPDRRLTHENERLARLARTLESLSYRQVLNRGYAVVRGPDRHPVQARDITPGLALTLDFADGEVAAMAGGAGGIDEKRPPRRARGRDEAARQGTLL